MSPRAGSLRPAINPDGLLRGLETGIRSGHDTPLGELGMAGRAKRLAYVRPNDSADTTIQHSAPHHNSHDDRQHFRSLRIFRTVLS